MFTPLQRDDTTHDQVYYLASEVDGVLSEFTPGVFERMRHAFEERYQRDWNDPASDEMKAIWSDAWTAALAAGAASKV